MAKSPGALEHEFYGDWVRMYSSDEFTELAEMCKRLINEYAEGKSEAELKRLEIVIDTSEYEYMFWDMAENISMTARSVSERLTR